MNLAHCRPDKLGILNRNDMKCITVNKDGRARHVLYHYLRCARPIMEREAANKGEATSVLLKASDELAALADHDLDDPHTLRMHVFPRSKIETRTASSNSPREVSELIEDLRKGIWKQMDQILIDRFLAENPS